MHELRMLLAIAATAAAADAHDCWIEPVAQAAPQEGQVGIRMFVGDQGEVEAHRRRAPAKIVRFSALGPAGEVAIEGEEGQEPCGRLATGEPGLYAIGYTNLPSTITLDAARFEAYLREEGLESIVELRAARGHSDRPGRERYSRCAKTLVAVGPPDAPGWERTFGFELELVPDTNPLLLRPNEELPLRLLLRGQPLANAKVHAWNRSRWDVRVEARTDAEGRTRLALPLGGRWVVAAVHMEEAREGPEEWESRWASLSFQMAGSPAFSAEVAIVHSAGLGGCAVVDVAPELAGHEVAAVASDGAVLVAGFDGRAWRQSEVHRAAGELIQVAGGDLVPDAPGAELIGVGVTRGTEDSGAPGAAVVLRRDGAAWRAETVFEDTALLHAVCVVDGKAWVSGYSKQVHLLERQGGAWKATRVGELPGPGRSAVPLQDGVAFACRDGSLALVRRDGPGWKVEVVDRREAGRSRIGAFGDNLVAADDDGALALVTGGARLELFRSSDKLRGAVLADLDPAVAGPEAATAGYDGAVVVLRKQGDAWQPEVVAREKGRFHGLACGPIAGSEGPSLAAASRSGRLVVVRRTP